MKTAISLLVTSLLLVSCHDHSSDNVTLHMNDHLKFDGTLKTENSTENLAESIQLKINNGYYECTTSLPYGYGAGKLEISNTTINFIDTAFFAIPAIYGPSYVLSGEHLYRFNGKKLTLWRTKNVGIIHYALTIKK